MLNKTVIVLSLILSLLSCTENTAVDTEFVTIYFESGRVFFNEVEVSNEDTLYIATDQKINLNCKYSVEDDKLIFNNWEVKYKYTQDPEYYHHYNQDIKIKRLNNLESITLSLEEYTYTDLRSSHDGNKLSFVAKLLDEIYIFDLKNDTERTVVLPYNDVRNHWWLNSEELVVQFTGYTEKYNFTLNQWDTYVGILKDHDDLAAPISGYYSELKWNNDLSRYYYILNKDSSDYICYYDNQNQNVLWKTESDNISIDEFEVTPEYNFYYIYIDDNNTSHVRYYDSTAGTITTVMVTTDEITFHKNYYNNELFYSIDDTDEFYLLKEDKTSELIYIGTDCDDAIRLSENRYSFKQNLDGFEVFRSVTVLEGENFKVLK